MVNSRRTTGYNVHHHHPLCEPNRRLSTSGDSSCVFLISDSQLEEKEPKTRANAKWIKLEETVRQSAKAARGTARSFIIGLSQSEFEAPKQKGSNCRLEVVAPGVHSSVVG